MAATRLGTRTALACMMASSACASTASGERDADAGAATGDAPEVAGGADGPDAAPSPDAEAGAGACVAEPDTSGSSSPPAGACSGAPDRSLVETFDLAREAAICRTGCAGDADPAGCTAGCVEAGTGISEGCAACAASFTGCVVGDCLADCLDDLHAEACSACVAAVCEPAFATCSGLPAIDLSGLDPAGAGGDAPDLAGACLNEEDLAIAGGVDLEQAAFSCAPECLFAASLDLCVAACLEAKTGVSEDCALCHGWISTCSITSCAAACTPSPASPACLGCVEEACAVPFATCSGLHGGALEDEPEPDQGPEVADSCMDELDQEAFATHDVPAITFACMDQCGANGPPAEGCLSSCFGGELWISLGCLGCLAEMAACSLVECPSDCGGGEATTPKCGACAVLACGFAFSACAGMEFPQLAPDGPGDAAACLGEGDAAVVASQDAGAAAAECVSVCYGDFGDDCAAECLHQALGLSPACAGCFSGFMACGLSACAEACAAPGSETCGLCLGEQCAPAFELCSGLDGSEAGVPPVLSNGPCASGPDQKVLAKKDVAALAVECAVESCSGAGDVSYCVRACLVQSAGVSETCASCYGDYASCEDDWCKKACAADPSSAGCAACLEESCSSAVEACAGTGT